MTRDDARQILTELDAMEAHGPMDEYERGLLQEIISSPQRISELMIKHYLAWKDQFTH